ncbi:MAG: restriction endonuclease subunit S [Breznakibacter sp.]
MKWEKVEIGQLGEVITGNTPPRKNPELYGDFIPFIKPTDMEIDRRYTPNPEECYSELGFEKYRKSLVPQGATCVVTIGSIGKKMTQACCDCFINQAVNAVIPNENYDKDFVYYLLKNNLDKVKGLDSGTSSGRENVSKSAFSSIEVKVTNHLPTQCRIASILSAYDDLIENNLKRIKLLEEKAFLRYKQIVREEKLEEFTIDEICDSLGGGTPATGNPNFWNDGDVLWFSPTDLTKHHSIVLLDSEKKITELGLQKSSAKLVPAKTILMTSRASIGYFGLINKPASTNQGFINIIPFNENHRAYMLFDLKNRKEEIIGNANGSTFLEISKGKFRQMKIKLPKDEKVLIDFEKEFEIVFNFIENLLKQNTKLREARDILLPRLMNGEIEV